MTERTCSIGNCESLVAHRGWCGSHYKRWYKYGDPLHIAKAYQVFDAYTKVCPACESIKPLDDFSPNGKTRSGRSTYCKPCQNMKVKLWNAKRPLEAVAKRAQYERRQKARANYGLTFAEYDALHAKDKCDICGAPGSGRWRRLHIDHDHTTGIVRGLLCHECNTALGLADEDPVRLRALADYLERGGASERSSLRHVPDRAG